MKSFQSKSRSGLRKSKSRKSRARTYKSKSTRKYKSKSTRKSKSTSRVGTRKSKSTARAGKKSRFGNHTSPTRSTRPWSVRCKDMKDTCKSTPTTLIGDDWCDVPEWDVFHDSTSGSCIQKSDVYAMFLASGDKIKHPISRRFFTPAEMADVLETLGRQGKLKTMTNSKYNDLIAHYGQKVADIYHQYTGMGLNAAQLDLAQFKGPSFQNVPRGADEGGEMYNLGSVLCSMLAHNLNENCKNFELNHKLYVMTKTLLLMGAWGDDLQLWESITTPSRFVKISNEVARFHDGTMKLHDIIRNLDTVVMLNTTLTYLLTPDFGLKRGVNFQSFGTLANIVSTFRKKYAEKNYAKKNLAFWDKIIKELKELHKLDG